MKPKPVLEKVRIEKSVGMVLAHDMTRIVPGKEKGAAFKKGHVVRESDIPELLKIGKRHIYVLNLTDDLIHEDEAALRIAAAICNGSLRFSPPSEGKSNIRAQGPGVLQVNADALLEINRIGRIIVATLKTDTTVEAGQTVAATRIIPLVIELKKIEALEAVAKAAYPLLEVRAYRHMRVGAVVTGSEIVSGLIKDEFDTFVGRKIAGYGATLVDKLKAPDDPRVISRCILELQRAGCELIVLTGGLSVDPDDVTRKGVASSGAEVEVYGAPVLPGAMFLYGRLGDCHILGLPACVYYHPTTIFDLVFPLLLAGDTAIPEKIARMGHGGLCLNCEVCRYPVCPFGK